MRKKKKAKEAKKLGHNRKPKVEKNPGIPNDWPFKEQELKALEARRARALEEVEQKKVARREKILSHERLLRNGLNTSGKKLQLLLSNVAHRNRDQTWGGNLRRHHQNQAVFCKRVIVLEPTHFKLLRNYSRSHELKKSITVGIIGLPNVGKSSLINSLKRVHVVNLEESFFFKIKF